MRYVGSDSSFATICCTLADILPDETSARRRSGGLFVVSSSAHMFARSPEHASGWQKFQHNK